MMVEKHYSLNHPTEMDKKSYCMSKTNPQIQVGTLTNIEALGFCEIFNKG
jgi:hypothetical protein